MLEKTLAILDRTRPHKHGALSPESLHAESQWGRPDKKKKKNQEEEKKMGQPGASQVRARVTRSQGGGVFPWVAAPHVRDGWQRPCGRVNRANVRSVPRPSYPAGHTASRLSDTHSSLEGTRGKM